jgi:hypothetical protein
LLNRSQAIEEIARIPKAPANCRAFFVSAAPLEDELGFDPGHFLRPNMDGMLLAELHGLPTVNGTSTFLPPGWQLLNPDDVSYRSFILDYAKSHGLQNVCGLNLRTREWEEPLN